MMLPTLTSEQTNSVKASIEAFDKSRSKLKARVRKYGLTVERYKAMLVEQDNKCAICGALFSEEDSNWYIDHCHTTGKVRGLLCLRCNLGLGWFSDDLNSLANAIQYLNANRTQLKDRRQVAIPERYFPGQLQPSINCNCPLPYHYLRCYKKQRIRPQQKDRTVKCS